MAQPQRQATLIPLGEVNGTMDVQRFTDLFDKVAEING